MVNHIQCTSSVLFTDSIHFKETGDVRESFQVMHATAVQLVKGNLSEVMANGLMS